MFAPSLDGSASSASNAQAEHADQGEDLPQQLFSRLVLEDASAVLREMLGGREVLVVDDNAVNRVVARKSLVGLGARVEVAASGELALQRLLHPHSFVLALVDINMPPGIDGFETCRHIRAREALSNPPLPSAAAAGASASASAAAAASTAPPAAVPPRLCVVALTADLDARIRKACEQAGMDGAISKPIVAQDLLSVLRSAGFAAPTAAGAT
ncbi:unnamed protein product [Closterium sp. NIES-53]